MAKIERFLNGNFYEIAEKLHNAVLSASFSATFEEESHFCSENGTECIVRVYERYSAFGGNRVSLTVTLFYDGKEISLSGITSGGSQALFFKVNTIGEEAFLETLEKAVDALSDV